jgi:hypothetical protein
MSFPQFSFIANNAKLDDRSGIAAWKYEVWDCGEWMNARHDAPFPTFLDASYMNQVIQAAYQRGLAEGLHRMEAKILDALK